VSQDDADAVAGGAPRRETGDLIEQIGAEIDRRLDARFDALGLTGAVATVTAPALPAQAVAGATGSRREAAAAPGAVPAPRRRGGVARSPWRSLWIGIMIGSAVTGAAAIAQGVTISNAVNEETGGGYTFANASWAILEALAGAWVLLFVIYIVQLVVDHARDHRR